MKLLDWICFIEVDEFIFSQKEVKFVDYLESFEQSLNQ